MQELTQLLNETLSGCLWSTIRLTIEVLIILYIYRAAKRYAEQQADLRKRIESLEAKQLDREITPLDQ